jgi:ankyrin repeat protein
MPLMMEIITFVLRFLWVAFQIEDLCRQKSDAEIRHTLKTLPKDLPETYQRALSRIIKDGSQELASQLFRWVAAAKRPLRLEELREAIAVIPGDEFLNRERLVNNADRLVPSCGGLLASDDEDIVVQFVHHTVQEFLISEEYQTVADSFHFDLSEIDLMAGEICVTYLNFNDFKRQLIPQQRSTPIIQPSNILESPTFTGQGRMADYGLKFARIALAKRSKTKFNIVQHLETIKGLEKDDSLQLQVQYAFLAYARSFWLSHTKSFSEVAPPIMNMWRQLIVKNHQVAPQPWFGEDGVLCMGDLLGYILEESHCAMIDCLISDGAGRGNVVNLLFHASRKGNVLLVNYMLSKRIYPQISSAIKSDFKVTALESAVAGDHMEVVDALLAIGANTDVGPASAALQRAAETGNLRMVERLLRANANVNAPPGFSFMTSGSRNLNAIQLAASSGSLDIVEMLLLAGADVNAPAAEDGGLTALQAAALHGHSNMVRRLLSSHADVNAAPAKRSGYTVMQAAEKSGSFDVIEVLLKPLGVIEIYVGRAPGLHPASSYVHITVSGIEMARTKTFPIGPNPWSPEWDEVLFFPLCHATTQIGIEIMGQGSRGKYHHCQLSGVILVSDLVVERGGIIMMRQPLRRTFPGVQTDSTLSCVISFYPCLDPAGISKQPDDDENLERLKLKPDFKSPRDSMRLTSQDDPAISPDDLIKCKTGFIMFKFSRWTAAPDRSSLQIQVLLDDLQFPSFSYTVAEFGNSQLKRMGNCFIRDLSLSKITFRMKNGGGQFDEVGRVVASRTQNTLDLLKQCLVCVHSPL